MSVEFEPIRLGRRGRRIEPVTLGALAVVVALGFAVIKPWAASGTAPGLPVDGSPPTAMASDVVELQATPVAVLPRVIQARGASSLSWDAIEGVLRRHDAWGVRAIVTVQQADSPISDRYRLVERWYPLAADGDAARAIVVDSNDRGVLALGVTFPPAHTPLDVRIWRRTDAGLEWVDTEPLDPVPSGGAFLYRRPGANPAAPRTWASGEYRIDILVDGSVRRFGIAIPDRFSNVPSAPTRPSLRDLGPMVAPTRALLTELPAGLFATVNGVAVPLGGIEGEPLDETTAWLDVDPGTGREPRSFVASAYLPRATGLGVALPARSVVMAGSVTRLAPDPLPVEPQRVDAGADGRTPSALALFRAPGGSEWEPGVYRLSLRWGDVEGLHDASWHVELRPGPIRETPRLLAAARGWARYAGSTGVILGTAEPLEGGPRSVTIRLVRLRPDTTAYPVTADIGCGGTVIDGNPGILGFAYPGDEYATTASARILLPFPSRRDQVMLTAAFGVRGLIIVAPARSPILAPGTYRFTIGDGERSRDYALCLGMATFDD
ncbi:MAG: hypothetical protein WEE50_10095 [Chloroflexota bacterium]